MPDVRNRHDLDFSEIQRLIELGKEFEHDLFPLVDRLHAMGIIPTSLGCDRSDVEDLNTVAVTVENSAFMFQSYVDTHDEWQWDGRGRIKGHLALLRPSGIDLGQTALPYDADVVRVDIGISRGHITFLCCPMD